MPIERITEATEYLVVLETKAINQEEVTQTITLVSTSLTINSKIHLLITMVIDSLNPTNKPSLSKTHVEKINQICKQSPSPQQQQQPQQGASFYAPNRNIYLHQRQSKSNNIQQQPNQISFVEGDNDYVNAITDFFPLNYESPRTLLKKTVLSQEYTSTNITLPPET